MTRNQRRAAALAQDLRSGGLQASDLSDTDWDLLLLAADLHDPRSVPLTVSSRVLERAMQRTGFFTESAASSARGGMMAVPGVEETVNSGPVLSL
jgi:hypothetical protein